MSLQKKWPVEISVHGRKITAEGKVTASVYHSAGEVGGSVEVEVSKRTPKDGVVAAIYSIDVSAKAKPGKRYSDAELYAAIAVALGALLLSTGAVVLVRRG